MITAPVNEAKTKLTELLRAVEAGERVVITRHGKPVAELVPPTEKPPYRNTWSLEAIEEYKRAHGMSMERIEIPEDFDDPLPDSFWFPEDDILNEK